MAKATAKRRRYRCRHPDCSQKKRSWATPQEVRMHRFNEHGEPWEREGARSQKKKGNGATTIPLTPTTRVSRARRSTTYAAILQTIPLKDLMGEIARRIPTGEA